MFGTGKIFVKVQLAVLSFQPVGDVFDIRTADDAAIGRLNGSSDPPARIARVGLPGRVTRDLDQLVAGGASNGGRAVG